MMKEADITFLDKVVCCYEDYGALIERSKEKTKTIYALGIRRRVCDGVDLQTPNFHSQVIPRFVSSFLA